MNTKLNRDARLMKYWAKHPKQGDAYNVPRMDALKQFVLFEANLDILPPKYPYNDWAADIESDRHKPIKDLQY